MRFAARLRKLEQHAESAGSVRDEIIACERSWVELTLMEAIRGRAHDEGTCETLRYHYPPVDHAPDKCHDDWKRDRWLLDAYDAAEPTPGWKPRVIEPGFYGAPDLDPAKVDAATARWILEYGMPDVPRTWNYVLCNIWEPARKRKEAGEPEPEPDPAPERGPFSVLSRSALEAIQALPEDSLETMTEADLVAFGEAHDRKAMAQLLPIVRKAKKVIGNGYQNSRCHD